jgi:hypothetical protein
MTMPSAAISRLIALVSVRPWLGTFDANSTFRPPGRFLSGRGDGTPVHS